jgi:hypothetical protein
MKIFISYSHDSQEHRDQILQLSNRLRRDGLDCWIDQYEQSPAEGWALWCDEQIEEAQFVLVACTNTYQRRFKKKEILDKGLGVTWEGHIITQELYNSQGRNEKFIHVIFSAADKKSIPLVLQGTNFYSLEEPSGYEALYRRLTGQPKVVKPVVGSIKILGSNETTKPSLSLSTQGEICRWNVPQVRNSFFTGREELFKLIAAALGSRRAVALSGLPGVGKTQIAVEYAYRCRAEYQAVLWVRAESRQSLISDFAQLLVCSDCRKQAYKKKKRLLRPRSDGSN